MDGHSHLTPPHPSTSEDHHGTTALDVHSPDNQNSSQDELDGAHSESSDDEDLDESADEDYEADVHPPSEDELNHDPRSGSEESQRHGKRKLVAEDEDYIKKDPELYGLRRSVSLPSNIIHAAY